MRLKSILLVLLAMVAGLSFAQVGAKPIPIGGNLYAIRPGHIEDIPRAIDGAATLEAGATVRVNDCPWARTWGPNDKPDNSAIDAYVRIIKAHRFKSIWQVGVWPHPSSPWGSGPDWWLPDRKVWPKMFEVIKERIQYIKSQLDPEGLETDFELANEPASSSLNPPGGPKPGGSNKGKYGEWVEPLHELLWNYVCILQDCGVAKANIYTPALSCFAEVREAPEILSCVPPSQWDWLRGKNTPKGYGCGKLVVHINCKASWAKPANYLDKFGNPDPVERLKQIKVGFSSSIDRAADLIAMRPEFLGLPIIVDEVYVTPYGCGSSLVPVLGLDGKQVTDWRGWPLFKPSESLTPFRKVAIDLLRAKGWGIAVYGLTDEVDAPGDPGAYFGGWGVDIPALSKPSTGAGR